MTAYLLKNWQLGVVGFLAISGLTSGADRTLAQITPDATLGAEGSVVTPGVDIGGQAADRIDGGATRGINLFHSFDQLNVGEGQRVYFANPAGIENILTRVTGTNASNILGTLGVSDGSANLFLINPNGIIFGKNASLDVGGSFLASTASYLNFADGTQFSATAPQTAPLLTVSVPIGLQFGTTAESIQNESQTTNSSGEVVGLQVQPGKTLALVGGDVSLDGGKLQSPGGRVELAGVTELGTVGLSVDGNNLGLSFADAVALSDVSLTNGAEVNVRAGGGGSIAINARNLNISGASTRVRAGIDSGLGSVDSQAGDIEIKATEAINIDASVISNAVLENATGIGGNVNITTGALSVTNGAQVNANTFGNGDGGSVNINARSLSITDGAQLSASTFGQGNSGSIFLQADNSVSLARNSGIFNNVGTGGVGNGGDINITAGSLSLTDGAQIATYVNYDRTDQLPSGRGDAGDVNINVRDSVTLVGRGRDSGTAITAFFAGVGFRGEGDGGDININARSLSLTNAVISSDTNGRGDAGDITIRVVDSIYLTNNDSVLEASRRSRIGNAVTWEGAVGNSGDIDIQSRSLFLDNGAVLDARTQGNGNAGNITVSANTLTATNGGQISTSNSGSFRAGTINLNVTDSVILSGSDPNFAQRIDDQFSLPIYIADSPASGVFTRTEGAGAAGNLQITTGQLIGRDGAQVNVSSTGSGIAGTLIVESDAIRLDSGGKLQAESAFGKGGNIQLQVTGLLLLRGNSLISAVSGAASGNDGSNGIDGNIDIETEFLVAVPKENSDIVATGYGRSVGSNIQVNAQGIFGTQFREQRTPQSDIVATGTVELNIPDVDPNQALTNLPTEVVDTSNQIDQTCAAGGTVASRQSRFVVTGSGGFPDSPNEALSPDAVWEDLRFVDNSKPLEVQPSVSVQGLATTSNQSTTNNRQPTIVEAKAWQLNQNGEVVLTANEQVGTPYSSWQKSGTCPHS